MITLPNLAIDFGAGGPDDEVMLTQEFGGNEHMVTVHPSQVRLIAERMGLVREVSASEADMVRTVSTLGRRMRLLRERVHHLHEMLLIVAGAGREDVGYEMTVCGATLDLLDEFCADLGPSRDVTPSHAPVKRDAPVTRPSKNGGAQRDLLLSADAEEPMANGCASDGKQMAYAIEGTQR